MAALVFAVILVVVGVGLALFGKYTDYNDNDRVYSFRWTAVIPFFLAFLFLVWAMYQPVGAREVGIPETFGHLGADLQPGAHFVAPWTNVHKCSLAQQQTIMTQAPTEGDKQGGDGIAVNGNDQGQGTADVTIIYHFDSKQAFDLYKRYGCDEDRIKANLMRPTAKNVIPALAANYPSLDLKAKRADISKAAEPLLDQILNPNGIDVDNVLISELTLSQPTQQAADAKLAAQQAAQKAEFARQQAETDAKTQQIQAAAAQQANNAKSTSLSPAILCQNWIDMLAVAKPTEIFVNGPCSAAQASLGGVIIQQGK